MARPCKRRRVWMEPEYCRFLPDGTPAEGCEVLTVDEFEAVRLLDLEGCTQEQCAGQMALPGPPWRTSMKAPAGRLPAAWSTAGRC